MPPDDFIANCKISLSELIEKEDQPIHDVWVSLKQQNNKNRKKLMDPKGLKIKS
jgi:hypothetical protein